LRKGKILSKSIEKTLAEYPNLEQYFGIDLITAGFPCQPFSIAGQRKGEADERYLWKELLEIISLLRPKKVLLENVSALRSIDSGRAFGRILGDLAEIGYDAEWHCIPASHVGAPHIRDRVWIIAYNDTENDSVSALIEVSPKDKMPRRNFQREWGSTVPNISRMDDGIPTRVHRLRALGNAIVPQVVEFLAKWLK